MKGLVVDNNKNNIRESSEKYPNFFFNNFLFQVLSSGQPDTYQAGRHRGAAAAREVLRVHLELDLAVHPGYLRGVRILPVSLLPVLLVGPAIIGPVDQLARHNNSIYVPDPYYWLLTLPVSNRLLKKRHVQCKENFTINSLISNETYRLEDAV